MIAGGVGTPHGDYDSAMQLLETGEFDRAGFKRLHVAGHPEGNRDIDPDGSRTNVDAALRWKQKFSDTTDAQMALTTQFAFDAKPIIKWADDLRDGGHHPAHPYRHRRAGQAADPDQVRHRLRCRPVAQGAAETRDGRHQAAHALRADRGADRLAAHKAAHPDCNIERVHFFPLGGIKPNAHWAIRHGGAAGTPANLRETA